MSVPARRVVKRLRPFVAGEKPDPLAPTFTNADGTPLDDIDTWTATARFQRPGGTVIDVLDLPIEDATVVATFPELDELGTWYAEVWVTNGTLNYASDLYVFDVGTPLTGDPGPPPDDIDVWVTLTLLQAEAALRVALELRVAALEADDAGDDTAIAAVASNLAAEAVARAAADTALGTAVTNEATARAAADTTLTNGLAAEVATRTALAASLPGTYGAYINLARDPESIISGAITRDVNAAATSAAVVWPDGSPGTYTATTVSVAFPGAVDAYTVTYGSPVTRTYTQPAVTRGATGAVTNRPALVVS
jgi:hypothetical protein